MSMSSRNRWDGIQRFDQARRRALLEQVSARLTGRDVRLLPFEPIRVELRRQNPLYRGLREVPVSAIVGSVGRYKEFTRKFLPLKDSLRDRWVGVDSLAANVGWPPVDLYQIGSVYFVSDGNHRISVARQMEIPTIEANVWEYPEDIQIEPGDKLDEVLIQLGERRFMQETGLEERIPDHNIRFTSPGRYSELSVQIQCLRQTLAQIDGEMMPYDEAVLAWYEIVYLPTVQIIRDSTLLSDFPGRTEADLFVWLSQHKERLQEHLGDYDNLADLAQLLADEYREGSLDKLSRQVRRLLGSDELPPLEVDIIDEDTDPNPNPNPNEAPLQSDEG